MIRCKDVIWSSYFSIRLSYLSYNILHIGNSIKIGGYNQRVRVGIGFRSWDKDSNLRRFGIGRGPKNVNDDQPWYVNKGIGGSDCILMEVLCVKVVLLDILV